MCTRREAGHKQAAAHKYLYSGIDAKHRIDADQPEEDIFLLNSSLKSAAFYMMAPVYSYLEWLSEQDLGSVYLEYLQHLQVFQSEAPQVRLTLKAPAHLWGMSSLLKAIPNGFVVQTHREPVEVLASINSLISTMHAGVCDSFDANRMARVNLRFFEEMVQRGEEALADFPSRQQLHVRYDDLVKDPIAMVRKLYEHFDLKLTNEVEERLDHFVNNRPKHKYGRHEYAIED
ncbi:MAG: sulfotransferase, partial [bacterium]|nr:sulfotransferase [bacterium]